MAQLLPFRPKDGLYLKDDFVSNEGVADTTLGELGWEFVTIGNADTVAYLVTTNTVAGRPGIVRFTTAATADGDGAAYRMDEDNIVLSGSTPGSISFGFRYVTAVASHNFRIGLGDSVTGTQSTVGIWLESDGGVLSLCAHSADHGDITVNVAGVSTLTSGTTAVADTWHDVEIVWGGENAQGGPKDVALYIDGELAAEINNAEIDNDEEMEFDIVHWQDSGGASAKAIDLDYIDLLIHAKRG